MSHRPSKAAVRRAVRSLLSRLPQFRGKGRITLMLDAVLTDSHDPASYHETALLLDRFPFHFDLRPWGQKFAFYYGAWEGDLITALRGAYRGGLFVDVGSSLGLYVVCMSDLVRKAGSRIISVEPIEQNRKRQQANVALNGIEDLVELEPVCLGAERGFVHLIADATGGDNNAFIATTGDLRCPVVPLDDLARERGWPRIGAVKIDAEGYDPLIIEGGRERIARDRPVLLIEFNRERMAINALTMGPSWNFLRDLGYHAFRVDRTRLIPVVDPAEHENLLFIPAEHDACEA